MSEWVTIEKAAERTGLATSYLHERTGPGGHWPEGKVWKWIDKRKMIDLTAMNAVFDKAVSTPTNRGRRGDSANDQCHALQAARQA